MRAFLQACCHISFARTIRAGHVATVLLLCLLTHSARGQEPADPKYWIFLSDKPAVADDQSSPVSDPVSDRARDRRRRRGRANGRWLDRPVSTQYLDSLGRLGVEPVTVSRWLNAVSARLSDSQRRRIEKVDFVEEVRLVGVSTDNQAATEHRSARPHTSNRFQNIPSGWWSGENGDGQIESGWRDPGYLEYGSAMEQLANINAIEPLEQGINGAGVRIGFLDTPFGEFDHPAFAHLTGSSRLIAVRDFVGKPQAGSTHGMSVASVAVGFDEGSLIGPAYGAEVLAAVTEYVPSETNQEEDFFVAGMEWLEAMGADVINVSLGYTTFDPGQRSYTTDDLDGDTAITTRAADRAASLGVVVVASAGNEGCSSPEICWYYVGTPADGDSVIAVGAVLPDSSRAAFSSFGPTSDRRTKPDVAAPGANVYIATPVGYARSAGTSFSSPLVAGVVCQMLQVNPDLAPMDVLRILRETASQSDNPDNELGWGVVNAAAAIATAQALGTDPETPGQEISAQVYPNPATDQIFIHINASVPGDVDVAVFDILGRSVIPSSSRSLTASETTIRLPTDGLSSGLYVYTVELGGSRTTGKFLVLP